MCHLYSAGLPLQCLVKFQVRDRLSAQVWMIDQVRITPTDSAQARRCGNVHHIHADAGKGDDLAAVQPFDDRPGQPNAPGGDDRVGVGRARNEPFDGARVDLHEFDAGPEDLELRLMAIDRVSELAARQQLDHDPLLCVLGRSFMQPDNLLWPVPDPAQCIDGRTPAGRVPMGMPPRAVGPRASRPVPACALRPTAQAGRRDAR